MDLGGFDATFDALQDDTKEETQPIVTKAWPLLDDWFIKASRSARWMDLLGDYAGSEHFVIHGQHSIFAVLVFKISSDRRRFIRRCPISDHS